MIIYYVFIISLLVTAIYFDLKTFHIPNSLNLCGCGLGCIYTLIFQGIYQVKASLLGMIIPVVLLFIFFIFKLIGAGDIKLLAAIGAFVQTDIFKVIIIAMFLTAVYGIGVVLFKLAKLIIHNQWTYKTTCIHMSIPIGVATCIFLIGGM